MPTTDGTSLREGGRARASCTVQSKGSLGGEVAEIRDAACSLVPTAVYAPCTPGSTVRRTSLPASQGTGLTICVRERSTQSDYIGTRYGRAGNERGGCRCDAGLHGGGGGKGGERNLHRETRRATRVRGRLFNGRLDQPLPPLGSFAMSGLDFQGSPLPSDRALFPPFPIKPCGCPRGRRPGRFLRYQTVLAVGDMEWGLSGSWRGSPTPPCAPGGRPVNIPQSFGAS